jgi:hypothetical protein
MHRKMGTHLGISRSVWSGVWDLSGEGTPAASRQKQCGEGPLSRDGTTPHATTRTRRAELEGPQPINGTAPLTPTADGEATSTNPKSKGRGEEKARSNSRRSNPRDWLGPNGPAPAIAPAGVCFKHTTESEISDAATQRIGG